MAYTGQTRSMSGSLSGVVRTCRLYETTSPILLQILLKLRSQVPHVCQPASRVSPPSVFRSRWADLNLSFCASKKLLYLRSHLRLVVSTKVGHLQYVLSACAEVSATARKSARCARRQHGTATSRGTGLCCSEQLLRLLRQTLSRTAMEMQPPDPQMGVAVEEGAVVVEGAGVAWEAGAEAPSLSLNSSQQTSRSISS